MEFSFWYVNCHVNHEQNSKEIGNFLLFKSYLFGYVTGLSLEPMIGAIAAGNTMVLKPSDLAPASASLLANVMPKYVDKKAIMVVEGGPHVGEYLLQQKWAKIFFTGLQNTYNSLVIFS